jgi:zinc transport system ATP-binding protein
MNTIPQAISLSHVTFGYGVSPVLDNLSCAVNEGDYVGLVGHNGSGKTTLLKLILGTLLPQQGTVKLFGTDIREFQDWNKVGYVPQKSALSGAQLPLTVGEVMYMEGVDGVQINTALSEVGMEKNKDKLLSELSGGQQQRVFIARALAKNPKLLILDEPTIGVDAATQERFYELMKHLNTSHNLTIVLVSHDLHTLSHQVKTVIQLDKTITCYSMDTKVQCTLPQ